MSSTMGYVLTALVSYLLGGINGAIIISRLFYGSDVREKGSRNAGLTNFYRCYGKKLVLPVLLIDLSKGMISVLLGKRLLATAGVSICGGALGLLAGILGHMFPLYFHFRGGKGVLSGVGALLMLDWRIALAAMAVFMLLVAIWHYVSLGSVTAAALLPLEAWLFGHDLPVIMMLLICGFLVVWKHRSNLGRLIRGEESKLKLR